MSVAGVKGDRLIETRSISVGEVIAWRAWKVIPELNFPLLSFSHDYFWTRGINTASEVPTPDNSSGFYALKDPNGILDYWGVSENWYCLGAVWLWGEIIVGTKGYRAQYAEVQNLVTLVRAKSRPPRVFNGSAAWRAAVNKKWAEGEWQSRDEEAGIVDREYDNCGEVISRLREIYL